MLTPTGWAALRWFPHRLSGWVNVVETCLIVLWWSSFSILRLSLQKKEKSPSLSHNTARKYIHFFFYIQSSLATYHPSPLEVFFLTLWKIISEAENMISGHVQIDWFVNWYLELLYIFTQLKILVSKVQIWVCRFTLFSPDRPLLMECNQWDIFVGGALSGWWQMAWSEQCILKLILFIINTATSLPSSHPQLESHHWILLRTSRDIF